MPILPHVFKNTKKQKTPDVKERKQREQKRKDREDKLKEKKQSAEEKKQDQDTGKKKEGAATPIKKEAAHGGYNVLVRPHISEKSVSQNSEQKYVFEIYPGVNKKQVARAIESVYDVKVEKVNKVHMPAKEKRYQRIRGRQSRYDKAIVTLKEGQQIEVLPQ